MTEKDFEKQIKDVISDYEGVVCILKTNPSLQIGDSLIEINGIEEIKK